MRAFIKIEGKEYPIRSINYDGDGDTILHVCVEDENGKFHTIFRPSYAGPDDVIKDDLSWKDFKQTSDMSAYGFADLDKVLIWRGNRPEKNRIETKLIYLRFYDITSLDDAINRWLEKHDVKVIDVKIESIVNPKSDQAYVAALIIYER